MPQFYYLFHLRGASFVLFICVVSFIFYFVKFMTLKQFSLLLLVLAYSLANY